MIELDADVLILGAGFGGSLMALLLERIGLKGVLVDRGAHPRFAIGESSTPIANFILRDLARKYDLPRLEPLAKYGTWQRTYPELICGLKRGFSYFKQHPGELFQQQADHGGELVVAASYDDEHSDTHWLRADVDSFLAQEVQQAGIPYFDRTLISEIREERGWHVAGEREGEPVRLTARFLIDATGEAGVLPRTLGIANGPLGLKTRSRTIFAHFANLTPWQDHLLAHGGNTADHPFCCDNAALHQVIEEGWMWQLRFNNGVTSAGFVLDEGRFPLDPALPIEAEWKTLLNRYPSLAEQFAAVEIVQPAGGLRRTGRLQRRAARVVGDNWALLPNTAGFIDPLHSTGIAHNLAGIERLTHILANCWNGDALRSELHKYEQIVLGEIALIDEMVHACFCAFRNFAFYPAVAMLYFAAATTYERRRLEVGFRPAAGFLCAEDPEFCHVVQALASRLSELLRQPVEAGAGAAFEREVKAAIAPYNHAGLCDPSLRNMYRYTAPLPP